MKIKVTSVSGHFVAGYLGLGITTRHTATAHRADPPGIVIKMAGPETDSP